MNKKLLLLLVGVLILTLSIPELSLAGDGKTHYGARVGFSQEPDQIVGGLQIITGQVLKIGRFSPSFDLGLGDNVTSIAVNGDFYLPLFNPPKSDLKFFAAFGPTLFYWSHDKGGSDTEIGISGSVGLTSPMGGSHLYSLELKLGFGDVPDLKLLFGFML